AELAGADGITVHLREDRRHIQDRDVRLLRQTVRSTLNLEMAATDAMIALAREIGPDIVTLVPEKREERTTEGGLDVTGTARDTIARAVSVLQEANTEVSLFIDPDRQQVAASAALGARRIELHTGDYCNARSPAHMRLELERIATAAEEAAARGLHVAAGHGLDYPNVGPVAAVGSIVELNIGHAIIARAMMVGLDRAVRDMIAAIRDARAL